MSAVSPKEHNLEFVQKLKGDETIGVDAEGRLYEVKQSKFTSFVKGVFQKNDPKVTSIVKSSIADLFLDKNFRSSTQSQEKYLSILNNAFKGNTSSSEKSSLALLWYNEKLNDLVEQGVKFEVAEAMIALEMCQDPYIPESIKSSIRPEPTSGGTSGSYFLKNRDGKKIGIFKPQDEEIYMPNNPRGYKAKLSDRRLGPRNGHEQGTSWQKEKAAWVLDKDQKANVPYTTTLTLSFPESPGSPNFVPKKGSLQLFANGSPVENFNDDDIVQIPVQEVHKIALFDLRVGNADRNFGNILYDQKRKTLTPIDHGLILLDSLDWKGSNTVSETNCHWLSWPQAREPFSEMDKRYILDIDIDQECENLREAGISEGSIREFKLRNIFLKEAVKLNFTPYEIGMCCMQTSGAADRTTLLDSAMRETFFTLMVDNENTPDEVFFEKFQEIVHNKLKKAAKS